MNDSFVFYRSFYDALREFKTSDRSKIYDAIFRYIFDGIEPELSGTSKAAWILIRPQLDANIRRRENGSKGGRPTKKETNGYEKVKPMVIENATETETETKPNVNVNVNANVNANVKVKKTAFKKPTVDEVSAYCRERRNSVNAERFVDFYESKGWRIGSQPMKDWKAAVRTWEQRDKEKDKDKPMQGSLAGDLDYLERLAMQDIKNA